MHQPVLLQSVIDGLALTPELTVVDATVNAAGHGGPIATLIPQGLFIGLDRDARAIDEARKRLAPFSDRVQLRVANYRNLDRILDEMKIEKIDRIFFDLGFSSDQLADSGRGFSFQTDEPLLMTYEAEVEAGQLTAKVIVNLSSEAELVRLFTEYGEEQFALLIARAIVRARSRKAIETTKDLVEIIRDAVPHWYRASTRRRHFATKIFQALRIAVNDEFGAMTEGLTAGFRRLVSGGRLAVITFHSGEARLVKTLFREWVKEGQGELVNKKAIKPSFTEVASNPRARSATLRIIKKI